MRLFIFRSNEVYQNKDSSQHIRLIFMMSSISSIRKSEMDFSKRGQRPDSRRSGPVIIRVSSKNWHSGQQSLVGGERTIRCGASTSGFNLPQPVRAAVGDEKHLVELMSITALCFPSEIIHPTHTSEYTLPQKRPAERLNTRTGSMTPTYTHWESYLTLSEDVWQDILQHCNHIQRNKSAH